MSHGANRLPDNEGGLTTPNSLLPGPPPLSLAVEVTTGDDTLSRDQKISEAVDRLIPAAFEHRHGILVTEQDIGMYTVQVDPSVPCGVIHEKRH
ncbi:hypothetical protein M1E17_20285 [Arthrobacter sp. D1-29]